MSQLINFAKQFFSQSLRSLNNALSTVFKMVLLVTKPQKFIVAIVQLIKSRLFSIVLLGVSLYIVVVSSMQSTSIVLKHLFPTWTPETIETITFRSVIFLEAVLVYFKLKRYSVLSWATMIIVMTYSIGSVIYDILENSNKYTWSQLAVYLLVIGVPAILSTVLMFVSSSDASKIPKNAKLDKAFTGKKKRAEKFSLTQEERDTLNKQILEHCDHHAATIESFRSIQGVFQDRVKSSNSIASLLLKERPILYADIKARQKAGRKKAKE